MNGRVSHQNYTAAEIDALFARHHRLHFIGIGGSGMYPLVQILLERGYAVTGSDVLEGDIVGYERALGIDVAVGPQRPENLGDAELVIYTAALLDDNPELLAARHKGLPCLERSQVLGYVSRLFADAVCIAGTHGKTTATSMLTQILLEAGREPGAVVGGKLSVIGGYGRMGAGELCVIEACEFVDTFLQLSPATAVILNVDADHLDYFGTLDNIVRSFHRFASMAARMVVLNGDDANTLRAAEGLTQRRVTFGRSSDNDYYPVDEKAGARAGWSFTLCRRGEPLDRVQLRVPGRHNVLNATAAAAVALEYGVTPESVLAALGRFAGAARRFELLGHVNGADVADDYAHHPAELRATLLAAREMGYRRIWAVFQPFTYSRTAALLDDFADALRLADHVVLTEIMGSRERNTYDIHSSDLAAKIPGAVVLPDFPAIDAYIRARVGEGDLVLTMGCGNVYGVAKLLCAGRSAPEGAAD